MTMGQIELDDERRKRLELEAGTMGEVYSPPSNTMEAINRVSMRPDDSRSNDELADSPAVSEQHTDAKAIAKTMEPKKSQREMLAGWFREQDAMLRSMTSERERVISDAEQASRGVDQGRSIINSLAAGGSILAGNKDLAKGYMAQAGEMPGQQKAEADRKALAAWVAKQAEQLNDRGRLIQQANKEDAEEYGNIQKGIAHAEELRRQAEIKAAEDKYRKEQDAKNAALRERSVRAQEKAAGIKSAELEDKKAKDAQEVAIPGFVLTGQARPSGPGETTKLREQVADATNVIDSASSLRSMVSKHGLEVGPGEARELMSAELSNLQLLLKNPAIYNLGQISGGDKDFLTDVTGKPTEATLRGLLAGGGAQLKRLDGIIRRAAGNIERRLSRSGYEPAWTEFEVNGKKYRKNIFGRVQEL